MDSSIIILTCVVLYMVFCVIIGLWAMRRTKSTHDFFMAGRNLGVMITGVAIFSSVMSGFGFVGGPGLVYKMGLSSFWILISSPIGFCIACYVVAKRIRVMAEKTDAISLPDIVFSWMATAVLLLPPSRGTSEGAAAKSSMSVQFFPLTVRKP